jgi:Papain-like cysteine protease AvrRpt2
MSTEAGSALWSVRYRVADLIGISSLTAQPAWHRLDLSVPHQREDNWCWAATSHGISHFYNPKTTWSQCAIADAETGRTDCCGSGASGPCNVYGFLDQALTIVGDFDHMDAVVASFATVHQQIHLDRPLGVRIAWSGGGAHFVAIGGYRAAPAQYVHVEDPWYGPSDVPYATLVNGYQGTGSWTHSYWTKP